MWILRACDSKESQGSDKPDSIQVKATRMTRREQLLQRKDNAIARDSRAQRLTNVWFHLQKATPSCVQHELGSCVVLY